MIFSQYFTEMIITSNVCLSSQSENQTLCCLMSDALHHLYQWIILVYERDTKVDTVIMLQGHTVCHCQAVR